MARMALITSPTTGCVVDLKNARYMDAAGFEDPELITMDMAVQFNGIASNANDTVTFARNATTTVKNATIRAKVNELLAAIEGAGPLTNANIQIVGLPV